MILCSKYIKLGFFKLYILVNEIFLFIIWKYYSFLTYWTQSNIYSYLFRLILFNLLSI